MRTSKKSTMTNGQKLRGWRLQNKFTQAYVGEMFGKNYRRISDYETGRCAIPEWIVSKLNKDYNLKLDVVKTTKSSTKSTTKTSNKSVTKTVTNSVKKSTKWSFADRISKVRNSMKMTQSAFAKKFNFVPSSLWSVENGKSDRISASSLKALFKAGVDLNTLVK